MKTLRFMAFLVLILVLLTTSVYADKFVVTDVKVNGIVAQAENNQNVIYVERGQTLPVEVFYVGAKPCTADDNNPCYDTRVRVSLGGYEYGDVNAVSEIFQVLPGVNDRKTLRLQLPNDLDASELYTLNVELFDDDDSVRMKYYLRVEEPRHNINIFDTILNPGTTLTAGQPLFASVRVENLGDNVEDSIKVTVSMPELGISTSEYVDLLITQQDVNRDGVVSSRRRSASTNDLLLMIPESARTGDYDVVVKVEFNRAHDTAEKRYIMHVNALQPATQTGPTGVQALRVNLASGVQTATSGQGAAYTLSVSNLGQQPEQVTFEVSGADGWGTARVDPKAVTINPNSAVDAVVYVAANEGTEGIKVFTVKTKLGNEVVSEQTLTLNVTKQVSNTSETAKKALIIGFVVLLAILVILAIVVIVKKLTEDKEDTPVEGQTYY